MSYTELLSAHLNTDIHSSHLDTTIADPPSHFLAFPNVVGEAQPAHAAVSKVT